MTAAGAPDQSASVEQLRGMQLERLRGSIRHAWQNVPHDPRRLAEPGVAVR